VDEVCGDRKPTTEDMMNLKFTTRVINESMRLYPQPPVLIRRAMEAVTLDGYEIEPGTDFFISVWNLHRNPRLWEEPDRVGRFGHISKLAPVSKASSTHCTPYPPHSTL
jgi:beta-ring hydroxylase